MRFLHILAQDVTIPQKERFLYFLELMAMVPDKAQNAHAVITVPDRMIETALQEQNIPYETEKFGGMFDLRTKKAFHDIHTHFSPHIILSHSKKSASFVAGHAKNILHISIIDDTDTDHGITHHGNETITIPPKSAQNRDDGEVLKTILTRFESILRQQQE